MKISIHTITVLLMLLVSCTGRAQMIKTVNEIDKLDSNKSYFVGKSIKNLLSEIKPEINMAKFVPQGFGSGRNSITLFFISVDKYNQYERDHKKQPPYIRVIVNKNDFEYNWNGLEWTKEMAKKYARYIVLDLYIYKG